MSMLLIYIYKYKVRLLLSPRPSLRRVSVLGESPRLLRQTGAAPPRRRNVLVAPLGTKPGNGIAYGILRPAVDARCRQTVPASIFLERRHRRAHAVGAEHLTPLAIHRRDFAELLADAESGPLSIPSNPAPSRPAASRRDTADRAVVPDDRRRGAAGHEKATATDDGPERAAAATATRRRLRRLHVREVEGGGVVVGVGTDNWTMVADGCEGALRYSPP